MSPNAINSFITDLFVIADLDKDGFVDWADISAVLDISNADIRPLFLGCVKVPTQFPIHHSESKIWSISEKYQVN